MYKRQGRTALAPWLFPVHSKESASFHSGMPSSVAAHESHCGWTASCLLYTSFQLVRDFADLLCIFVFSHIKPPFRICFGEKKTPSGICSINEPLPQTGFLCVSADDERCYPRFPIQSVCQTSVSYTHLVSCLQTAHYLTMVQS